MTQSNAEYVTLVHNPLSSAHISQSLVPTARYARLWLPSHCESDRANCVGACYILGTYAEPLSYSKKTSSLFEVAYRGNS